MAQNTVKAVISHNQEIGGKKHKAGDEISLDPALARALASRGGIKFKSESEAAKAAPAPTNKEVSK